MLCSNIGINESGHLTFAGEDTVRIAALEEGGALQNAAVSYGRGPHPRKLPRV